MDFEQIIDNLFNSAKNYDDLSEWEYIQTIMRDKYSNNCYSSKQVIKYEDIFNSLSKHDNTKSFQRQILEENNNFISSLINIMNNEMDFFDAVRLRLVTYSYITEVKYLQDVLINMLWILCGKTFYHDPFSKNVLEANLSQNELKSLSLNEMSTRTITKTEKRVDIILYLCKKTNQKDLEKYLKSFYNNHLRNTIYHSKYIFSEDGFIGFDKKCTIKLDYEELMEKLNNCIYYFICLNKKIDEHRRSYKKAKTIKGRNLNDPLGGDISKIKIIANERLGIVQTWLEIKKEKNIKDEDSMDDFIKFAEDYDLFLKQNNIDPMGEEL